MAEVMQKEKFFTRLANSSKVRLASSIVFLHLSLAGCSKEPTLSDAFRMKLAPETESRLSALAKKFGLSSNQLYWLSISANWDNFTRADFTSERDIINAILSVLKDPSLNFDNELELARLYCLAAEEQLEEFSKWQDKPKESSEYQAYLLFKQNYDGKKTRYNSLRAFSKSCPWEMQAEIIVTLANYLKEHPECKEYPEYNE